MLTSLRIRIATTVLAAGAIASVGALVAPAHAATTGDTTTTFSLTAGALGITAPANASLGSGATGTSTLTAQLGAVSVADGRGALLGSWTASVTSTDFTTGTATADETIANDSVDYWSGAATATSGTGVFVPGQLLAANRVTMAASRTAFGATGVIGNNSVSWNPTAVVNVPSAAVAGTYSGTVTHSIA